MTDRRHPDPTGRERLTELRKRRVDAVRSPCQEGNVAECIVAQTGPAFGTYAVNCNASAHTA
jgi:hypothetical protein